jgi:hypothetical protein
MSKRALGSAHRRTSCGGRVGELRRRWVAYVPGAYLVRLPLDAALALSRSSVRMARLLARGRLLTGTGFGHTELHNPSRCVARQEVA